MVASVFGFAAVKEMFIQMSIRMSMHISMQKSRHLVVALNGLAPLHERLNERDKARERALHSLYSRCIVAMQSPYSQCTVAVPVSVQSVYSQHIVCVQSHCSQDSVIVKSCAQSM